MKKAAASDCKRLFHFDTQSRSDFASSKAPRGERRDKTSAAKLNLGFGSKKRKGQFPIRNGKITRKNPCGRFFVAALLPTPPHPTDNHETHPDRDAHPAGDRTAAAAPHGALRHAGPLRHIVRRAGDVRLRRGFRPGAGRRMDAKAAAALRRARIRAMGRREQADRGDDRSVRHHDAGVRAAAGPGDRIPVRIPALAPRIRHRGGRSLPRIRVPHARLRRPLLHHPRYERRVATGGPPQRDAARRHDRQALPGCRHAPHRLPHPQRRSPGRRHPARPRLPPVR